MLKRLDVVRVKELEKVDVLGDVCRVLRHLGLKHCVHVVINYVEYVYIFICFLRGVSTCLALKFLNQFFFNNSFKLKIVHWTQYNRRYHILLIHNWHVVSENVTAIESSPVQMTVYQA